MHILYILYQECALPLWCPKLTILLNNWKFVQFPILTFLVYLEFAEFLVWPVWLVWLVYTSHTCIPVIPGIPLNFWTKYWGGPFYLCSLHVLFRNNPWCALNVCMCKVYILCILTCSNSILYKAVYVNAYPFLQILFYVDQFLRCYLEKTTGNLPPILSSWITGTVH